MKKGFFILGLMLLPVMASANVVISEIMYDLTGADSGREWVEIFNSGAEFVDLTNWKLYEAETNHKINLFKKTDSFVLPANSYAVIADDPAKFLIDWPNFAGVVYDSTFSLSNIGETVVIRNAELVDINSIAYGSEWGANGDGNSLQYVNENWRALNPTPGAINFVLKIEPVVPVLAPVFVPEPVVSEAVVEEGQEAQEAQEVQEAQETKVAVAVSTAPVTSKTIYYFSAVLGFAIFAGLGIFFIRHKSRI